MNNNGATRVGRVCRRLLLLAGAMSAVFGSMQAFGFYTSGGKIFDGGGNEVVLHGLNHHGFNDPILQPQYLWTMGWKEQIAQIKSLGFTAVRLPIVPDVLYSQTPVDQLCYVEPTKNADLYGKTPLQVLDMWMAEADRQGLYVMINMYSASKLQQYPTWFITNPADYALSYKNAAYTEADWIHDLGFLAARYRNVAHFVAIDLYNEPNGYARWSTGTDVSNSAYYWKRAAEAASASILAANPDLLIFVEGLARNPDGVENSGLPMNWGEDLQPQAYQPLAIPADKLVLSPHSYGPDVYVKSTFYASNFPANLAADWDQLFGKYYPASMVAVGEWGGNHGLGPSGAWDTTWEDAFAAYMESRGIKNEFWWAYTPNSAGTGGILDDNLNVRLDKLAMLQTLWSFSPPVVAGSTTGDTGSGTGTTTGGTTTGGTTTGGTTTGGTTTGGTTTGGTTTGGTTTPAPKPGHGHKKLLSLGATDPRLLLVLIALLAPRLVRRGPFTRIACTSMVPSPGAPGANSPR